MSFLHKCFNKQVSLLSLITLLEKDTQQCEHNMSSLKTQYKLSKNELKYSVDKQLELEQMLSLYLKEHHLSDTLKKTIDFESTFCNWKHTTTNRVWDFITSTEYLILLEKANYKKEYKKRIHLKNSINELESCIQKNTIELQLYIARNRLISQEIFYYKNN